ncbi:hypothetical protein [Pseudochryseolinea flava]|uniref:NnrS family protein n=1 Tax=Pseudochryseolinea flava TaxID=2059302 RepID=A0A364Y677_9BACT|nr:hypothetical protein [Pseudochryseolinea flava]RAW02561.1 hypothetical protein DQQ10_00125 [Pseudochryseolinea flava]
MQKFVKIPFIFLFVGSLLGVFLRLQFVSPTPGINYSNFLHGHSHVMFLGWVFNVLLIGFTLNHIREDDQRGVRLLFIILQFLLLGMLVSFPIQGYGFFSILLSTMHTLAAFFFIAKFIKKVKSMTSISAWCAVVALVFFMISSIGPFSLGYLMASGLGKSQWYFFSIYFYLHFQYNGFFFFGVLSLFFNLLERRQIPFDVFGAKRICKMFAFACVPAYFLSVLWAKPGISYNVVSAIAAIIQLVAFMAMLGLLRKVFAHMRTKFRPEVQWLLIVVTMALLIKLILQLLSAFPIAAQLAYELRPVVIAYLHLALVGVISFFLMAWYGELERVSIWFWNGIKLFFICFIAMEICLVLSPWWRAIFGVHFISAADVLLFFSIGLSISCLLLMMGFSKRAKAFLV